MKESNKKLIGIICTLTGAALWGSCAVVSKFLISDCGLDTMWMSNFRMLMSGVILLIVAAIRNPHGIFDIWKKKESVIRLLMIAVFAFGICQVTYFLAIQYCNAGIATAIQQTAPVFVLIFVIISERRRPTAVELLVLAMVLVGSFLIATHGRLNELSIAPQALFFGLCSAITCALYITLPPPLIRSYGTFETVGWGLFLGGLFLTPICQLWNGPAAFTPQIVAGLAYVIIPGAVIAFATYLYGTSLIGPVKAGIYGLFEPVVATFASLIFLGQSFSAADFVGIAAILGSITILTLSKK